MARRLLSSKTAAHPSGREKRKGETPTGGLVINSTSKSGRRARQQVDRFCSCTRNSTCLMLGPSFQACEFRNARRQCMYYVCWRQCKNCGAFLTWTPGGGLYRHFRTAENTPRSKLLCIGVTRASGRTGGGRHRLDIGRWQRRILHRRRRVFDGGKIRKIGDGGGPRRL